ncbi:uncharacterized protein FOMMEDRAFT_18880 [Fomitiporia mediterranea MF3/22]|uniref:uncharacterized protein n=1 Tax=Fomitiporia mediterranea (strain MF3/22) TaxID=694068 RepID=UPI0004408FB2|nr:uncharacterized protein FOMMEDRAFT_18880 [Fomitiporia mediterranea MF3/22]EJD05281.1 hypothetical protein FOMMEDRAFT_18880 [Fomitiporia mediterranea MF3/22]
MKPAQKLTSARSYSPEKALDDLPAIKHAEYLFLNSNMVESERYCIELDPRRERLYITSGYCLIQCLKALMSYEDEDLQEASKQVKHGNSLAYQHRAPAPPLVSRIVGLVWETSVTGVSAIRNMTPVQRHAELLYAETLFAKALLGVVCSGSWLSFLTEALNFRTMINIYLQLGKYLESADAEARARGDGPEDKSIDKDFRSGVELGVGASNLILSLMPERLLAVAEIFGYKGNREVGLKLLMKTGGWVKGEKEPRVSSEEEGIRRPLVDICLLCFHLVVSSVTYRGVDLEMAQTILDWNLKRFPNGVFFLFAQGRLAILRSQPSVALSSHNRALSVQAQYHSLHYVSFWELAMAYMSLWDVPAALIQWRALEKEATWSKACYIYGVASCLLQMGVDGEEGRERKREAGVLLERIPGVVHKIAGKSIPIEKFVARKARKFKSQGNRLLLPALELAYMFLAIDHAPRDVLLERMIPDVDKAIEGISKFERKESLYLGNGLGYWDDFCLAHLLRGVCWRFYAYPDKDAVISSDDEITPSARKEAENKALSSLKWVIENGSKIHLDHYILYNAHYELGRLFLCMKDFEQARYHLELVLSGKPLETDPTTRKGKYSMQSTLILRTTAVLEALDHQSKLDVRS